MSQEGKPNEQRLNERSSLVTFCWYKRIDDAALESDEGVAQVRDVSQGGLGLMTSNALAVGARLLVEIVSDVGRVSALGRVTHCMRASEHAHRVGLRIETVPPNDQVTWRRLVSR